MYAGPCERYASRRDGPWDQLRLGPRGGSTECILAPAKPTTLTSNVCSVRVVQEWRSVLCPGPKTKNKQKERPYDVVLPVGIDRWLRQT